MFNACATDCVESNSGEVEMPASQSTYRICMIQDPISPVVICSNLETCVFEVEEQHQHRSDYRETFVCILS